MLDLIGENRLDEVTDYLVTEIQKVASAGADFAVLASNTPYILLCCQFNLIGFAVL